jgi:hypothetical protein
MLESWRSNQDEDGWGNPHDYDNRFVDDDCWEEMGDSKGAPKTVKAAPWLQGDLSCLLELTENRVPLLSSTVHHHMFGLSTE